MCFSVFGKHYETDKVEMFGVAPPAAYTAPNLYITRAITCRYKSHRQIKPSTWFTAGINTTRSACVRETWYERWVDRRLHPPTSVRHPLALQSPPPPAARAALKQRGSPQNIMSQFLYLPINLIISKLLQHCIRKSVCRKTWIEFYGTLRYKSFKYCFVASSDKNIYFKLRLFYKHPLHVINIEKIW
jgi:hypothetical protein